MNELDKLLRAKMYIEKLANGVDPVADREMPEDALLNNPRLIRCFFYVAEVLGKVIENGGEVGKPAGVIRLPFSITPEQKARIELSEEPTGVSVLAKRVAVVLDGGIKSVSAVQINQWCLLKGYLREEIYAGNKRKVAASAGERIGILTLDGISPQGMPYKKNIFDINAQRHIIENLESIIPDLERDQDSGI